MEHSEWKEGERRRRGGRGGWWSICLHCCSHGSWTRSGGMWLANVLFPLPRWRSFCYEADCDGGKNGPIIILVARGVRELISKRLNLGVSGKWLPRSNISCCTQASVLCPSSLNSFHIVINSCIIIPSAKGIGFVTVTFPLRRMLRLWVPELEKDNGGSL